MSSALCIRLGLQLTSQLQAYSTIMRRAWVRCGVTAVGQVRGRWPRLLGVRRGRGHGLRRACAGGSCLTPTPCTTGQDRLAKCRESGLPWPRGVARGKGRCRAGRASLRTLRGAGGMATGGGFGGQWGKEQPNARDHSPNPPFPVRRVHTTAVAALNAGFWCWLSIKGALSDAAAEETDPAAGRGRRYGASRKRGGGAASRKGADRSPRAHHTRLALRWARVWHSHRRWIAGGAMHTAVFESDLQPEGDTSYRCSLVPLTLRQCRVRRCRLHTAEFDKKESTACCRLHIFRV